MLWQAKLIFMLVEDEKRLFLFMNVVAKLCTDVSSVGIVLRYGGV